MASPSAASDPARSSRRRPDEVRQLLIAAAERLVVHKGAGVSALEIAREAGVHRSVLYRHFAGSEELIREAMLGPLNEFLAMFQSLTEEELAGPQPLWDLMVGFLERLLQSLVQHRDFLLAAMADPSLIGGSEAAGLRDRVDEVVARLARLNEAEGRLRGIDTSQIASRTRLVLAMAAGVTTYGDWLLPAEGDEAARSHVVQDMADLILYGMKAVDPAVKAADRRPPAVAGPGDVS